MLYILLGIAGVIGLFLMTKYNAMVTLRNNREKSFADIDVQLKQRFDLVPNLVSAVKGYATHEKETFENITKARSNYQEAKTTDQKVAASNMLSSALSGLNLVVENYPDLKANEGFNNLQIELSDIENKIAAARRFFNSATTEFNTYIQMFPANIVAGMFGFSKAELFATESEEERQNVKVEF
ncbi:MAG: LemA family protein [Candidatus Gracilibacteria bacterium]|nr:LemA family protein [Candidatus Gracilibacteria bacterium]